MAGVVCGLWSSALGFQLSALGYCALAESREPRAESREPRAESREPSALSLALLRHSYCLPVRRVETEPRLAHLGGARADVDRERARLDDAGHRRVEEGERLLVERE